LFLDLRLKQNDDRQVPKCASDRFETGLKEKPGAVQAPGSPPPEFPRVFCSYSAAWETGVFFDSWNCSVSVEPAMAVVDERPPDTAIATASK
jgi:hypothetical protein